MFMGFFPGIKVGICPNKRHYVRFYESLSLDDLLCDPNVNYRGTPRPQRLGWWCFVHPTNCGGCRAPIARYPTDVRFLP